MTQYAWLGYYIGTICAAGSVPVLMKQGVKKADICIGAGIISAVLMILGGVLIYKQQVAFIGIWKEKSFLYLLAVGVVLFGAVICGLRAVASGEVTRVIPVMLSEKILYPIISVYVIEHSKMEIKQWGIFAMMLVGIILMVWERPTKKVRTSHRWLVYSVISMLLLFGAHLIFNYKVSGMDNRLELVILCAQLLIMSLIMLFATRGHGQIGSITFLNGLSMLTAGIAIAGAAYMYGKLRTLTDTALIDRAIHLDLAIMVVIACVFLRERISQIAFAGLILLSAGMFFL